MIVTFIGYYIVVFWLLFIYVKIMKIKPTFMTIVVQMLYSVTLVALIILIQPIIPESITFVIIVFSCIFNKVISKAEWGIVIVATVISCGISNVLNILSGILCSLIFGFIFGPDKVNVNNKTMFLLFVFTFFFMGAFVIGLFKIKRFKSGFPFLHERNTNFIGALIALIIAFYYTIISLSADRLDGELNIASWLAVLGIIVCAILIIVWWRTGITKKYRDYLFSQEIEELKGIIAEKEARIVEIEKSNNYLSRQIHSDNKLISSLLSMVRRMSEEYSPELAADVLSELNRISAQRKDALHKYYKEAKKLPPTSVISLDTTLDYMKQKAYENNIEFDVIVTGNIKKMIKEKIEEERLRLITADLLENAIIAVKPCKTRKILFAIGIFEGFYEIRADDSGVDFEPETLRDLGKKQTTTHENEGGSGIGMMEIFDVMRETGASLEIKRLSECGFTKRVALKFDGAGEFRDKI